MTLVRLAPDATALNGGAITGAGSAHAAMSDGSDSSYITFEYSEGAIFTLGDLSLPSGGRVIAAQVMARCRRPSVWGSSVRLDSSLSAGTQYATGQTIVSWYVPSEAGGAGIIGGLSDSDIDGASIGVSNQSPVAGDVIVFELALQVLYYEQPTVTVDAPSGTINTNLVRVDWTPTIDQHAEGPVAYEVKVFSSAQYGAGGFNPSSSTPTLSGSGTNGQTSTLFASTVADGTYRAYVRVRAANVTDHWSDWEYSQFVVDAPKPGVPNMVLTPDAANGAITVALDDQAGDVTTDRFEVQRSDDAGATWVNVRTVLGDGQVTPVVGNATVTDHEAPNGATVLYRARAYNAATPSYSAWVEDDTMWESDAVWLKCATHPSLNWSGILRSYPSANRPANQTNHRALGASKAITVSDTRGPWSGPIVVMTDDLQHREQLQALLETNSPVLIQVPVANETPQRWVTFGDEQSERFADKAFVSENDESLTWTEVEAPVGPVLE